MLEEDIVKAGAFKLGDFTLASGRKSDYYVDLRSVTTRPILLKKVAETMAQHMGKCDRIAGVELGAIPIAVALSLETGIPFLMVRKQKKDHGAGKLVEGELLAGDKVLFVEDTVTTAGSLIKAIEAVRKLGGVVEKALVIVDREEGARENLSRIGVEMVSIASIGKLRACIEDGA
ncbi:MAG: orotate phosphoribosyltransferase [Candidatus Thermoplasmatota archaeon]|nr:orotate phosphoribosyltransferase [Euryarchaeota archaeon]MBU4033109.1 orotate phosphoribosyltransferase [Candidatus Thermoplasmatota archaeon]MBU4071509.1 orotate phosphoribosyltransferase [Candidatus Thermoplasmatota archaeon]MBU4143430.1 orotate phosphoribosyltransferase [Candidatus Thermoplasmatota archaeon]MBU4591422.1 orotate phosphoribosyltransferase [Candidatus Thermoplasmatota archaeon]